VTPKLALSCQLRRAGPAQHVYRYYARCHLAAPETIKDTSRPARLAGPHGAGASARAVFDGRRLSVATSAAGGELAPGIYTLRLDEGRGRRLRVRLTLT
jgi:hypothetical protein